MLKNTVVEEVAQLPLHKLKVSSFNVRKKHIYDDMKDLIDSVSAIGVKTPLIVREYRANNYEVVTGQRRYIASRKAGLKTVPCIIRKYADDADMIIESFSENIFRSDMTISDKANATKILKKKFNGNIKTVAEKIGVSQVTVYKYLEYDAMPELLKKLLRTTKMNYSTAKTIFKKTKNDMKQMEKIVDAYLKKNIHEKSDYYTAIKESKGTKLKDIDDTYAKIKKTVKTQIRLPSRDSKYIEELAKGKNISQELVIAELISIGIYQIKRGEAKI